MNLVIERGRTVDFEALPDWSIALDGYVQGPAIDNVRHRYSFDHHRGCIRLITRATCEQVRDALLLGLDPSRFTVFVNDVDTDTALSVWALRNPSRLTEPAAFEMITAAGLLDAHGGAFRLPRRRLLIEWLGEPETSSRSSGEYEHLSAEGLRRLLDEICARADRLVDGRGPSDAELAKFGVTPELEILREGTGWTLVKANHPHALTDLYRRGVERIVAARPVADGSWAYTVARRSDFVENFDVPRILAALDAVEPGWGGGSTIGGAPRNPDGSRSRLTPDQVFDIVEAEVRASRA